MHDSGRDDRGRNDGTAERASGRVIRTRRRLLGIVREEVARRGLPPLEERRLIDRLTAALSGFSISRRRFLKQTAAGGMVTAIAVDPRLSRLAGGDPDGLRSLFTLAGPKEAVTAQLLSPSFTASVLRREDMLALRFEFFNLALVGTNLERQTAADPAYIVVHLGHETDHAPQNIAEEAYSEPGETPEQPGHVSALLAGPSRLAFKLDPVVMRLPFALDTLLGWEEFEQHVAANALPPGATPPFPGPEPAPPSEIETAIEAPWSLTLSPHGGAAWAHAHTPITREGRTELWHSRLAVRKPDPDKPAEFIPDENDDALRTMRAIWTPGADGPAPPDTNPPPGPFRMSLSPNDRWQIVHLSSNFSLSFPAAGPPIPYIPKAIDVNQFMLTSLGAWMNTQLDIDAPPFPLPPTGILGFDLLQWRHIATMARDHYVRVVELGCLLPFGHLAVLITITERKFEGVPLTLPPTSLTGKPAAYLRQRKFIVPLQRVVTYPMASPQPDEGRKMPFKSVRIATLLTPDLDPSFVPWDLVGLGEDAFFPPVGGAAFPFHIIATDIDSQPCEFKMPLAFASVAVNAQMGAIVDEYNDPTTFVPAATRTADLGGCKVAYALPTPGKNDTTIPTKSMTFGAELPIGPSDLRFFPVWKEADVRLNGVEQLSGNDLGVAIQPHPAFVSGGYTGGNSAAQVFAKLKNAKGLDFGGGGNGDKSGAVITPNMQIVHISRKLGPVGGGLPSEPPPPDFDPKKFFFNAKILGGISLGDIIDTVVGSLDDAPGMTTRTIYPGGDTSQPPQAVETMLTFMPPLIAGPPPLNIFRPDPGSLTITAKFLTPLDPPGEPEFEVVGDLRDFIITLLGEQPVAIKFLAIRFNKLVVTAKNGKKPDVDVDIDKVEFAGVLEFVNTLKDFLKTGGTGPSIELSTSPPGVTASFTIAIPTVGVGILTIQNIAFSAALTVPFTGEPARVRFCFSEREKPFLLTVIGLGGGGFFCIAIGLDGVEMLEAGLEAGASLALDIGVASGEVHAMLGVYFKMVFKPTEEAVLEGYVRLGGSLEVLGIITVTLEFYLGFKYLLDTNELFGVAKLTVEVEVLFFSASVELEVEKRIAGPSQAGFSLTAGQVGAQALQTPALNFADVIGQPDWNDYAGAFAAL